MSYYKRSSFNRDSLLALLETAYPEDRREGSFWQYLRSASLPRLLEKMAVDAFTGDISLSERQEEVLRHQLLFLRDKGMLDM